MKLNIIKLFKTKNWKTESDMNEEMKCDNYYYKHSMLASDDDTVAMERTSPTSLLLLTLLIGHFTLQWGRGLLSLGSAPDWPWPRDLWPPQWPAGSPPAASRCPWWPWHPAPHQGTISAYLHEHRHEVIEHHKQWQICAIVPWTQVL